MNSLSILLTPTDFGAPTPHGITLEGAVCDGVIKQGVAFTCAYSVSMDKRNPSSPEVIYSNRRVVKLVVRRIVFRGKPWDELDEGMTGIFELAGEGAELLLDHDLLMDQDPHS